MSKVKNVVFRAPALTSSGYGTHARQIASYLLKLNDERSDIDVTFDLVPWGTTPWLVDPEACDGLVGKILERSRRKESYDVSLQLQLPNEWDPFLAETNIGMSAVVETDRCNPQWVDACNRMDMVIVPSDFTKTVLENSGKLETSVKVVNESWLPAISKILDEKNQNLLKEELKLETDFNFLMVSQFTGNNPENDRKNIAYTVKWVMEQFKDNPEVGLIIKTNFGRLTKSDMHNTAQVLGNLIAECQRGPGPKIYLLHGKMTDEEMVDLYTHPKVKALINLTRGEGFGLPILEAATCGLPVIATNWSAHTEFLNKGKFIKIDYTLSQIHPSRVDNQIFVQEAQWANPIEQDVKRKLKKFYESPRIPQQWAKELSEKLLKSHSPEAIEEQYEEVLKEVL